MSTLYSTKVTAIGQSVLMSVAAMDGRGRW